MIRPALHKLALQWLAIIGLSLGSVAPAGAVAFADQGEAGEASVAAKPTDGNWILICSPTGYQWLNLDNPDQRIPLSSGGDAVKCSGCTLAAGKTITAANINFGVPNRQSRSLAFFSIFDALAPNDHISYAKRPRAPPA